MLIIGLPTRKLFPPSTPFRIDELLDVIHGATLSLKLDLQAGCFQILVRAEDTQNGLPYT